ncbi:hypothetical protein [Streptomyces sp. GZWMJZ-114]|uniref:hypothetical protein n=1 Tax=Streptomyces sp. GZWMJZ-114 TaxID=2494734 RepID=UPI0010133F0B|nr:hypothetical protein [Streptomyces sp. GZWMJZ-114]
MPSSLDTRLVATFGAPVSELYIVATTSKPPAGLPRALELRSFLALAEQQVARVRDRVHAYTAPERDMGELSAQAMRYDAEWLDAALEARSGYRNALSSVLAADPSAKRVRTSAAVALVGKRSGAPVRSAHPH